MKVTFALVYQAGIANVFRLTDMGRYNVRERVYQGDFRTAENLVRGAKLAGAPTAVFACNMAGDISQQAWTSNLAIQPFSDKFNCADLDNIRE